ncbi:MAG: MspA family porin [Mycobacteriaceae bacterium]
MSVGFRVSRIVSGVSSVTALCCAAVLGTGSVSAETVVLEDQVASRVTDDGWVLTLAATELAATPVPNLATTLFTREGFVSAKITGTIEGQGTTGIKTGYLEQGLQLGCQVDVSNGVALGLGLSFGPNVGVTISGVPSVNVGVNAGVNPSVNATIKPGAITTIPLGSKTLEAAKGSITVDWAHISVDGCLGPVTIRTYGRLSVSTKTADNSMYVYSDTTWL